MECLEFILTTFESISLYCEVFGQIKKSRNMSSRSGYSGFSFKNSSNQQSNSASKNYSMNAVPPPSSLANSSRGNLKVRVFFEIF